MPFTPLESQEPVGLGDLFQAAFGEVAYQTAANKAACPSVRQRSAPTRPMQPNRMIDSINLIVWRLRRS